MFNVVLYEPEIPPNTGNVIRLCANAGAQLHLVKPLGFNTDDKTLKRAGMDYREMVDVKIHENWDACMAALKTGERAPRLFCLTTKGSTRHDVPAYQKGDVFVFGPESRGLPQEILDTVAAEQRIRLPMQTACRSLNLGNTVAVVVYEAWRQMGFEGGV